MEKQINTRANILNPLSEIIAQEHPLDGQQTAKGICPYCKKELGYLWPAIGILDDCDCEKAQEALQLRVREQEKVEMEKAQEQKKLEKIERIKKLFDSSCIGLRFRDRTFETYVPKVDQQRFALKMSRDFIEKFLENQNTQGLFFLGSVGTGKTHLAAAIANELISKHSIPVVFGTVTSLMARLRQTFSNNGKESEHELTKELTEAPLLIIDDLGKEYSKRDATGWSWTHEKLYEIINSRYENYLPIIVTTNLSMEDLEAKTDPAIVSRIFEMCRGVICNWNDYRKAK